MSISEIQLYNALKTRPGDHELYAEVAFYIIAILSIVLLQFLFLQRLQYRTGSRR